MVVVWQVVVQSSSINIMQRFKWPYALFMAFPPTQESSVLIHWQLRKSMIFLFQWTQKKRRRKTCLHRLESPIRPRPRDLQQRLRNRYDYFLFHSRFSKLKIVLLRKQSSIQPEDARKNVFVCVSNSIIIIKNYRITSSNLCNILSETCLHFKSVVIEALRVWK